MDPNGMEPLALSCESSRVRQAVCPLLGIMFYRWVWRWISYLHLLTWHIFLSHDPTSKRTRMGSLDVRNPSTWNCCSNFKDTSSNGGSRSEDSFSTEKNWIGIFMQVGWSSCPWKFSSGPIQKAEVWILSFEPMMGYRQYRQKNFFQIRRTKTYANGDAMHSTI